MKILTVIFILNTVSLIIEVVGVHEANQTLNRRKRLAITNDNGDANFNDFRFTVAVEEWGGLFQGRFCGFGYHSCGGSLINPRFVLTAAHCVERQWFQLPRKMKVRAGSPKKESGGSLHDVVRFIEHEEYRQRSQGFDIALLELKTVIDVQDTHARVIPLVGHDFVPETGIKVKTAGWGRLADKTFPEHLQSLQLKIISTGTCNMIYGGTAVVTGEFCAQSNDGTTMDGDSGGPVIRHNGERDELVGIVVRGREDHPDIFVNVAYFRRWIDQYIH